ncbi:MAG: hypothetical protein IRZ32_17215 [Solirubrobacteraceae bacterium]|nr:hypothetical protein [Solirubrobacteraceae bacterium]
MAASERSAPGGVALVGILAIIIGVIQLIAGILLLIFNGDVDGYSSTEAVIAGIVLLIAGAIYLWVGRGLLRLNRVAYAIGLFVLAFRAAYDLVFLIAVGLDGIGFSGLISLVVNLLLLAALWSGRDAFADR